MDKPSLKYAVMGGLGLSFVVFMVLSQAVPHEFKNMRDSFLKSYYKTYPVNATWIGVHDYDGALTDYSGEAIQSRVVYLKNISESIQSLDVKRLNRDDRIDYEIMLDAIRSELFDLLELKEYSWNPLLYMGELGFAFESLTGFDFAPADARAASLKGRLLQTPEYLRQAEAMLESCPKIHLETGIRQCDGVIGMLTSGMDSFLEHVDSELSGEIRISSENALKSLNGFKAFLESKLDDEHRDFRLGADLYEHKLSHTLREGISSKDVLSRAEATLKKTQDEMAVLAAPLYEEWFNEKPNTETHSGKLALIRRVLDEIGKDHVGRDEVMEDALGTVDELTQFIIEKDLLTLDPEKPLEVRPMPEFQRGVSVANLQAPGPLESNLQTYYNVSPIPEDWDDDRVESFLKEYNRISVKILSIHEALPGHYVQLYYANRHPSLIRSVFSSGVMIEGWAHYTEAMMIKEGLGGGDPRYDLVQKKWLLRGTSNAIIDQKIHAGNMTRDEAMDLMVNETFQEYAEASAKWVRAQLTSAQLSEYFVGNMLIEDLQKEYQQKHGDDFSLKTFHESLLSQGSIPVRYLREILID